MKQRKEQISSGFENPTNQLLLHMEPTDDYKTMINQMIKEEESGEAKYVSLEDIKKRFKY